MLAEEILTNAAETQKQFGCKVYILLIPPRSDAPNRNKVEEANKWINHIKNNSPIYADITLIQHESLSINHLRDSKHLSMQANNGGLSGCQILANNIYTAMEFRPP